MSDGVHAGFGLALNRHPAGRGNICSALDLDLLLLARPAEPHHEPTDAQADDGHKQDHADDGDGAHRCRPTSRVVSVTT